MTIGGSQTKKRVNWVDYAKFLGIYLVVLGHMNIPDAVKIPIYTFHMPLFFFISGYLFSFEKYNNYQSFFIHRSKQILIPYLFFNVLTFCFWVIVGRKFGNEAEAHIKIYIPLMGMIYGNGNGNYLIHDRVLWFLPCLFMVENFYYLLFKNKGQIKSLIVLTGFVILGFLCYSYIKLHLPWGADTAFVAIVFYGCANIFQNPIKSMLSLKSLILFFVLIVVSVLFMFISPLNGRVDMLGLAFGNYSLFILVAFCGIIITLLLSRLLDIFFQRVKFVEYVSSFTIIIMALHSLAFTIIKSLSYFLLKLPLTIYDNNLLFNCVIAFLSILILIPFMYVTNLYVPFLIGKPKYITK
jgi:acyltransferase